MVMDSLCLSPLRPEQLQLRFLEKIIILQDSYDLEQIGLLIVSVHFDLVDQVGQHRVKGNDRVHAFALQQIDALVAGLPVLR